MKMNYAEQGENAMSPEETNSGNKGINVPIYSEEEETLSWMREMRIRLCTQVELEVYRNELDWLTKCHLCAVNDYPKEYCPPMPLPTPPGYHTNLEKGAQIAAKGIFSPTLMILL